MIESRFLIMDLFTHGMIKTGDFTLRSGRKSPVYCDLRDIPSYPTLMHGVVQSLCDKANAIAHPRSANLLYAGLPMAGLPLAVAMGYEHRVPVIYPRKEVKGHGTKKAIEGAFGEGDYALVIDDLITEGVTKLDLIAPMLDAKLVVENVLVIIDREQGGKEQLAAREIKLHSLFTLRQCLDCLLEESMITAPVHIEIMDYLDQAKMASIPGA